MAGKRREETWNGDVPARRRKLRSGEKVDLTPYGIPGAILSGRGAEVYEYEDGTLVPILSNLGSLLRYAFARLILEGTCPLSNGELRFIRKHMNVTQDEFGKILGLTRETINRLESGKERVTEATSNNIRYCGIKFLMQGPQSKAPHKKASGPTHELSALTGCFQSIAKNIRSEMPRNMKLELC